MSFLKKFTKKSSEKVDSEPSFKESQSQPINYNDPNKKPPTKKPSIVKTQTKDISNKKDNPDEENPEQNAEEILPEVNPLDTLIQMKKGDYNVHILIEEVKNLISIKDNVPPVPRVKVTVFDKVQRTAKMKNPCFDFAFNEHFYFDKTNMTVEMLDSEKIIIEVYDNKHTNKKDYFGIYEIDFAYVYGRPDHVLRNTWIGLSNTESDDMTKIRGYLKLSVSVLNEDDNRVELEPKDSGNDMCLMPNEIKMKYKQISFYFIRGEKFPDMDSIVYEKKGDAKRCDGYIIMKYMGIVRKTKVVPMKKEVCLWYQVIDLPATDPCVSQKICMTVMDEDVRNDDIVGSYEFFINDIYNGKYSQFDYIDIYGSPLNEHTKLAEQMGYNAEIGSRWNGKVFMKCEIKEVDSPTSSVRDISDNRIISEAKKITDKEPYTWKLWVRVMSALYLPHKDRDYKIKISIQEYQVKTSKKKAINNSIDFDETLKLDFKSLHSDKASVPDIFIYLEDKTQKESNQNVSFQRIKAEEFYLCNDVLYIKLVPDPVINKAKSMMVSGLLKCKICLFNPKIDQPPDIKEFEQTGQFKLASLGSGGKFLGGGDMQFYKILAIVYMSKGLVAAESSGTSDPFVTLKLAEKEKSTNFKQNTMNGVWNEVLEFDEIYMDIKDQRTWPVFLLNVYDHNKYLKDVPLGYNYLWLSNSHFSINSFDLIKPKWHDLFLPKSNIKQGQILMSFYIFDNTIKEKGKELYDKINFLPKTELYNFEINVLGLRELKPLGLISVKKPFIKFDLNSLNVTGKPEDDHTPIKTIPVSGGENPTINTVIQFETKLPKQEEFLPELQCEVYDNILSGMAKSLLGVFSINLKKIVKVTKIQIEEDIDEARGNIGLNTLASGIFKSLNFNFNNMKFGNNIISINTNNNIINTNTNNNIINTNTNNNIINTNTNNNISNNIVNPIEDGMKEKNEDNIIEDKKENNINNDNIINTNSNQVEKDALSNVSSD